MSTADKEVRIVIKATCTQTELTAVLEQVKALDVKNLEWELSWV